MRNETLDNSKVVAFCVMRSPMILSFMVALAFAVVAEGADSLGSTNSDATARRRPGALRQIVAGRLPTLDRTPLTTPGRQGGTRLLRVVGRFVYVPTFAPNDLSGVDTILVEVRDDDAVGHSVIWSGYTDENGHFDTGVVDISDDDNEPDLYVYFETNSPFVSVEDGDIISDNYFWDSLDSLLVDDFTGEFLDFGTHAPAETGTDSDTAALDILVFINRAHRFVLQVTNLNISKVNALWPSGDDYGYDYDGEISLGQFSKDFRQILHLYAHHLERAVGMVVSANNDCSNDCQYCERGGTNCNTVVACKWCPMTPGIARSEGFAAWFPPAANRAFMARYAFDSGEPFDFIGLFSNEDGEFFPPEIFPDDPFGDVTDLSEVRAICGADALDNADRVIHVVTAMLEDLADDRMDDHAGDGRNECAYLTDGTVLTTYLIDKPADVLALIDLLILEFPNYLPELYSAALNMAPLYTSRFPADVEPPGVVHGVTSPSHPIGQGGPLPCITLEWQLPLDDVTGACAYSYEWTTDPAGLEPDMVEDVAATCTMSDGPFDLGQYYISMRAKDCAGHWSSEWNKFGPFEVIDCNDNGIVDACEAACIPPAPELACDIASFCVAIAACSVNNDCNRNHVPDECDIAAGASEDCDEDATPDECQFMRHWAGESGSWHDENNWEEGAVPASDFHVCIDDPEGDVTVTYVNGAAQLANIACSENLIISGSTSPWIDVTLLAPSFVRGDLTFGGSSNSILNLGSYLVVDGLLTLERGTVDGSDLDGGLTLLQANGGVRVDNGTTVNSVYLRQTNASASVATDWISLDGESIFKLDPSSSFDFQGNGVVFFGDFGRFENEGIFLRSAGTGDAQIDVFTRNDGLIHVMTGTLVLSRENTSSGQFMGDPGTHLELRGGGHEFRPGSSIVADIVDFRGGISGSNRIRGTYNVTTATTQDGGKAVTFTNEATIISYGRNLQIPHGTLNFEAIVGGPINFDSISIGSPSHAGTANFAGGDPVTTDTLTLGPGLLTGPSEITVNGLLTWNAGGGFEGPGIINANGGLVIESGAGEKNLWHRVMNNAGYCTALGGFVMNYDDSMFNNLPGAVLDIQLDPGGDVTSFGTLNNAGTLVKTAGTGTSTIGSFVTNTGTVEVKTGVLEFYTFGGLDYVQSAGQTILNGGDLSMFGPAPLAINGGVLTGQGTISGNVNVDGGTVAPGLTAGTLFINGEYTQSACSTLEIEIEGSAPGDFDVLEVSGNAALAGTLHIIELGESVPAAGERLTILTASAVSGQFESVVGSANYKVQHNAQDVTLIRIALGDLNGNGDIDLVDASKLLLCFGGSGEPPATTCPAGVNADLDSDGDVDWNDWAVFAKQYQNKSR